MEKFSFFNDINDDRVYYAEDFARHLKKFFTNGVFNNELGVCANDDMTITIAEGDANINGYRYTNTSSLTKTIVPADGVLKRIDNVIIRLNLTNRLISALIVQGEFNDNPVAPGLVRNATIYDIKLAEIFVDAGITSITQSAIKDTRYDEEVCGIVVSTVKTLDTSNIYNQLYDKYSEYVEQTKSEFQQIKDNYDNYIDRAEVNFNKWFEQIKDITNSGDLSALANEIVNARSSFSSLSSRLDYKPYYFDSLSNMKASKLKIGDCAITLGFRKINDGGSSKYHIRKQQNNDICDEFKLIPLQDNLVAELIEDSTLRFHAVAKSSATYIVQFPNGKNMFIDTGMSSQWDDIKVAIDGLGITKFEYGILTHFHSDHVGNIQRFFDNFDLSECEIFVGLKPDFINHIDDIAETENSYDSVITLLTNNGILPIVPENDSYKTIDANTKLHFLNTSSEIAENYYGRITEYRTERKLNFNHFSLVTELIFNGKVITLTGDIEKVNEEYLNNYMRKSDIITSPHHGVNVAAYRPFYENLRPDYSLNMYISESNEWMHPFYNSFMYLKESGCRMVTPDGTQPINGLFSFIINNNNVYFLNNGDDVIAPGRESPYQYTQIAQIFDRSKILASELTLEDLFEAMVPCSTLQVYCWSSYSNTYPNLFEDIKALFPTFVGGFLRLYKDINHYRLIEVSINSFNTNFKAVSNTEIFSLKPVFSNGIIPDLTNTSILADELLKYPVGQYSMNYFKEEEDNSVLSSGAYQLNINIISNNGANMCANVFAILRDTGHTGNNICRIGCCYINTTSTPKYLWHQINN